jgi:hypothetical protein
MIIGNQPPLRHWSNCFFNVIMMIGNHLGDTGAKNIAQALLLCRSLRSVGLRGNMIGILENHLLILDLY